MQDSSARNNWYYVLSTQKRGVDTLFRGSSNSKAEAYDFSKSVLSAEESASSLRTRSAFSVLFSNLEQSIQAYPPCNYMGVITQYYVRSEPDIFAHAFASSLRLSTTAE